MATRATIWMEQKDGTYKGIYCHWDGYPEHTGELLCEYYNIEEKVQELISGGHISFLGKHYYPKDNSSHSFDNPAKNVTIVYHRDRKDEPLKHLYATILGECIQQCYNYLFKSGNWYLITQKDGLTKLEF